MNYLNIFKHYSASAKSAIIISLLFVIINISCKRSDKSDIYNNKYSEAFLSASKQANVHSKSNSDSAIYYADMAITLLHKMDYNNSDTLFSLIKIKATTYINKDLFDSAISILERKYNEAVDQNDLYLQARIAILIGGFAYNKDKLSIVEKYIPNAIKIMENQKNEDEKSMAYNIYGAYLGKKGENKKAIEFLMKAYKIFDTKKMFSSLSFVCVNIGNNFTAIGSNKDALNYYRIAVDAATKSKDTANLMSTLGNIGVYYREENSDSAIFYYDKVIALKPADNTNVFVISAQYNKANLYLDKKDYKKALVEYNKVLAICKLTENYTGMAYAYNGISSVYGGRGEKNLSIVLLNRAVNLADSLGATQLTMLLKDQLQTAYENNAKYKEAYLLSKEIKVFNDSTMSVEKQIAIHNIEESYQSEKKALENKLLKTEILKKNNLLISRSLIIIFLLIVSLIFGVLFWRTYIINKQRIIANDVLMKKYKQERELRIEQDIAAILENSKTATVAPDVSLQLYDQIMEYYTTKKPYLDPMFKVETIIADLNSSHKAILQALKLKNHNFNTITNLFRVEEAKKRMADQSYNNFKIEAIAKDSGFGTKMSFYNAFEQLTGVKPSFYRNNILSNSKTV